MNTDLLNIQPTELKFHFELRKQSSCSIQLTNKTDKPVAFKVKTTNPKKYCVRPNTGIVLPRTASTVTVTMQAPKEAPLETQCKDKFLVQSVVAPDGTTSKEITADLFNKQEGKVVEEFKLRVVYISANPPSPVPEESEEGYSPEASLNENASPNGSSIHEVSKTLEESKEKSSEAWLVISKLNEEKASAVQKSQRIQQELELLKKETSQNKGSGYSLVLMVMVGVFGVLIGYLLKRA